MKLKITSDIEMKDLVSILSEQLTEEKKVKFAIDLGKDGDLTYELMLLKEIAKLITKVYPLKSLEKDADLYDVIDTLLTLKKQLELI